MPWQLQPIIWPIIIATLALLAVPHKARPQEVSSAVRAACEGDMRALCPDEYAAQDGPAIATCMKSHAPFIGKPPFVSTDCVNAWLAEHPANRRKKK
jgi:hypothetical protein